MIACKAAVKYGDRLTPDEVAGPAGSAASGPGPPSLPPRSADGAGLHPRATRSAVQADLIICRTSSTMGSTIAATRRGAHPIVAYPTYRSGVSDSMICVAIGRSRHKHIWPSTAPRRAGGQDGRAAARLRHEPGQHPSLARRASDRTARSSSLVAAEKMGANGPVPRRRGCCCSAKRSPRASTTSISKKTSPARSRVSARPSGSSATTTSARRRKICGELHHRHVAVRPRHRQDCHDGQ